MLHLDSIDDGDVSSHFLRLKKQRSDFVSPTGQL